jgi:hypothetical protein
VLPSPTLTFAFILATLYGAAFHLILGGDARRLVLLLLAGWLGFGLGQFLGIVLRIDLFDIGILRAGSATLGALAALVAVSFLTSSRMRRRVARKT